MGKIYKKILRYIKEILNTWKGLPYSQIGSVNIIKISPVLIYKFNVIPIFKTSTVLCFFSN